MNGPRGSSSFAIGRSAIGNRRSAIGNRQSAIGNAFLVCLLLSACGSDGPQEGEDYGNLLNSPAGLVIVEEEHPTGYGRPDCLACHETRSMHVVNRTGLPDCPTDPNEVPAEGCIDLAEIRALIRSQSEESCAPCHGRNGVEP